MSSAMRRVDMTALRHSATSIQHTFMQIGGGETAMGDPRVMKFRQQTQVGTAKIGGQFLFSRVYAVTEEIPTVSESVDETREHERVFQHETTALFADRQQFRQGETQSRQSAVIERFGGGWRRAQQILLKVPDAEKALVGGETTFDSYFQNEFIAGPPDDRRSPIRLKRPRGAKAGKLFRKTLFYPAPRAVQTYHPPGKNGICPTGVHRLYWVECKVR